MRITFVLPYANLAGGIRVIAEYARHLSARGHAVTLVSQPRREPRMRDKVRSLLRGRGWPRLKPERSHLDGLPVPHRVLERPRPVTDADVPDADVVIATWWETAEWVSRLSPAKGAKVYFLQHVETVFHETQPHLIPRVEATWRLPMHRVAVSNWIANTVMADTGGEVAVVLNAVDTGVFTAPPRGKQPRPSVGLLYAQPRFKGCDVALDAFRRARREVPELHLVCFGAEAPDREVALPERAKFTFRPPQPQIAELYASCDAWLFASRCEGFGLPILEAMACRTPVIATPAGAAPELVPSGGGLMVRMEDPEDMARAIIEVARMPEAEWRRRSDAAWVRAQQCSWDEATARFEAELQRAAAARTGELTAA